MKKMLFGLFAAALTCAAVMAQDAEVAPVEEADCSLVPHVYLDMAIQNRYMSDGEIVNPHTMLMYTAGVAFDCGLYADIWVAQDVNEYNKGSKIGKWDPEEIDFTVGYGYTFEDVPFFKSLSTDVNWSYWRYPHRSGFFGVGETQKRISLSAVSGLFLNPGLNIKWDYENSEVQIVPSISYSYDINDKLTASTKLEAFWFNANWRYGRRVKHNKQNRPSGGNGFATIVWSVALDYQINENFSCGPFAKLGFDCNHNTRERWDNSDNHKSGVNNLVGFHVSANF